MDHIKCWIMTAIACVCGFHSTPPSHGQHYVAFSQAFCLMKSLLLLLKGIDNA